MYSAQNTLFLKPSSRQVTLLHYFICADFSAVDIALVETTLHFFRLPIDTTLHFLYTATGDYTTLFYTASRDTLHFLYTANQWRLDCTFFTLPMETTLHFLYTATGGDTALFFFTPPISGDYAAFSLLCHWRLHCSLHCYWYQDIAALIALRNPSAMRQERVKNTTSCFYNSLATVLVIKIRLSFFWVLLLCSHSL